jgi:hypothetical protein
MTHTVDLHHHVIPDSYWEASNEDGNAAGGINPPSWSLDGAIAYLDEARIDVAVLDAMNVIPGAGQHGQFAETVNRLHWDTASAFGDPVLHLLRSVTGLDNVAS